MDVHRAARICSAAHGGQVLVSSTTRELVVAELDAGVALDDLGEHRLKDLDRPERLYQVVAQGLAVEFPPPRSEAAADGASRLPSAPNRTIGRDGDVRAIADRIRGGDVRLLTLTGPGGVGKTRLAVEAARALAPDFADGARFVSLAALTRHEDVPAAIVTALAIVLLSGETAEEAVTRYPGGKEHALGRGQPRARARGGAVHRRACSEHAPHSQPWRQAASPSPCGPRLAIRWAR